MLVLSRRKVYSVCNTLTSFVDMANMLQYREYFMLQWLNITPFGFPVDPLVYMMIAQSFGWGRLHSTSLDDFPSSARFSKLLTCMLASASLLASNVLCNCELITITFFRNAEHCGETASIFGRVSWLQNTHEDSVSANA